MSQITEGEALDKVLKYLVDNRSDLPIASYKIWKDVFPSQKPQVAYYLLKKLIYKDDIVTAHVRNEDLNNFDVFFEATDLTEVFIRQGGFTAHSAKQTAENAEKEKTEALNRKKLESEVDLIEFQRGLGRRLTIWGFIVATLSVVASVITTAMQDKNSDKSELKDLTEKIDSVSFRLRQLETKAWKHQDQPVDTVNK